MKKTININLAGYPFIIDEDAYKLLKDYLDTIRYAFQTNGDTEDLAVDIESRIAEILLENSNGNLPIITVEQISSVIERIGKPSDFIEIDVEVKEYETTHQKEKEEININEETVSPPPYNPQPKSKNPLVRKNLFRDPQNAMLGGVCSGLAHYLGMDVTIIRLLTVLLFFLSASTVAIVYIILWIVVPEARTPFQRMKMMGENPTVENIGRTVTENFQENENLNSGNSLQEAQGILSKIFSFIIKCLIILGLIIACPLLLALAIGLLGCIIAVFVLGVIIVGGSSTFWVFNRASEEIFAFYILLAVIGGIITIGIPLWLLIRKVWKKKDTEMSPANNKAMLIVWLCGIALLSVFCVKAVKKGKQLEAIKWESRHESLDNIEINEDVDNISISEEGVKIQDKNGKTVTIDKRGVEIETAEIKGKEGTMTDTVISKEILEDTLKTISTKPIITEDSIKG